MSWLITGKEAGPADPYIGNVGLLLHGEGSSIIDSSPLANTITIGGGAASSTTQAKFGNKSIYIAESGDSATVTNNIFELGVDNFTLEYWVYFPSGFTYTTGMVPVAIRDGGSVNVFLPFNIRNSDGLVTTFIWGDSTWSIALNVAFTTIVRDTWLYWVISRNGSNWRTFENGTLKGSFTSSESVINRTGTTDVRLGDVQCFIDELRFTKGIARYAEGTGANAGKMVFAGTNTLALPTAPFPDI